MARSENSELQMPSVNGLDRGPAAGEVTACKEPAQDLELRATRRLPLSAVQCAVHSTSFTTFPNMTWHPQMRLVVKGQD